MTCTADTTPCIDWLGNEPLGEPRIDLSTALDGSTTPIELQSSGEATVELVAAPPEPMPTTLPHTGAGTLMALTVVGAALVAAGIALVRGARRYDHVAS